MLENQNKQIIIPIYKKDTKEDVNKYTYIRFLGVTYKINNEITREKLNKGANRNNYKTNNK